MRETSDMQRAALAAQYRLPVAAYIFGLVLCLSVWMSLGHYAWRKMVAAPSTSTVEMRLSSSNLCIS